MTEHPFRIIRELNKFYSHENFLRPFTLWPLLTRFRRLTGTVRDPIKLTASNKRNVVFAKWRKNESTSDLKGGGKIVISPPPQPWPRRKRLFLHIWLHLTFCRPVCHFRAALYEYSARIRAHLSRSQRGLRLIKEGIRARRIFLLSVKWFLDKSIGETWRGVDNEGGNRRFRFGGGGGSKKPNKGAIKRNETRT